MRIVEFVLTWIILAFLILAGLAAVTIGIVAALSPAEAQQRATCAPYLAVIEQLADRHGETMLWSGQTGRPDLGVRLFAAADGSTWTVVVVSGDVGCITAAGTSWTAGSAVPSGEPS